MSADTRQFFGSTEVFQVHCANTACQREMEGQFASADAMRNNETYCSFGCMDADAERRATRQVVAQAARDAAYAAMQRGDMEAWERATRTAMDNA